MDQKTCIDCGLSKPIEQFKKVRSKYRMKVCDECRLSRVCINCGHKSSGNKICWKCYEPVFRPRNPQQSKRAWLNQLLRSTKACSPSRQLRSYRVKENNLTIEFLLSLWDLQLGCCAITKIALTTYSGEPCSASIDRIDPNLGYLQTNVQLVCKWVNLGRGRITVERFRSINIAHQQMNND
jgi:hypothetical protein